MVREFVQKVRYDNPAVLVCRFWCRTPSDLEYIENNKLSSSHIRQQSFPAIFYVYFGHLSIIKAIFNRPVFLDILSSVRVYRESPAFE